MKPQIYILEIKGENADKLGDLTKDIVKELEPLVLPYDCWFDVRKKEVDSFAAIVKNKARKSKVKRKRSK